MKGRAREEETKVSMEYLSSLHEKHESWFKPALQPGVLTPKVRSPALVPSIVTSHSIHSKMKWGGGLLHTGSDASSQCCIEREPPFPQRRYYDGVLTLCDSANRFS